MLAANGGLGPGYRRAVVADKSVMWIAPTERGAASNEPRKRCVALCQSAAAATRHVASVCCAAGRFQDLRQKWSVHAARRACRNSPLFVWVLRVRAYPKCSSRRSARHAVRLLARGLVGTGSRGVTGRSPRRPKNRMACHPAYLHGGVCLASRPRPCRLAALARAIFTRSTGTGWAEASGRGGDWR